MNNSNDFTVEDLIKQMNTIFRDSRQTEKIVDRLNYIRQDNNSFRSFLNKFDCILLKVQDFDGDNTIKKGYLRWTLARKLADYMISVEESNSYSGYCFQLYRIDDRQQEMEEMKPQFIDVLLTIHQLTSTDKMNGKPTRPQMATATQKTIDKIMKLHTKWISQKKIDKRKKNGDCFCYDSTDHCIVNCNYSSAKRPTISVNSMKNKEKSQRNQRQRKFISRRSQILKRLQIQKPNSFGSKSWPETKDTKTKANRLKEI